ncbi:MAG: HD domain-containing phosphohydrolase [Elusimicrobiota bacterium]
MVATLYKVVDTIQTEYNLEQLFNKIMQSILQTIHADRGFLIISEPNTCAVMPVVSVGKISAGGISMSVINHSLKDGFSVLSSDTFIDDRFKMGQSIITHNIRSVICVPVESKNKILGAIYLDTIGRTKNFTEPELELLSAIGKHAGIAIERAGLIKELEEMFHSAIRSMVSAIDAKDVYTKGHSERVTNYSLIVGKKMGFTDDELTILKLAAILHDVGKIGIPDRILQKPSKLTDDEFAIIKEHPVKGAKIVENIKNTEKLILGIKHHHEHWDGSGYPDGLKSEEIPKIAQIINLKNA